MGLIEGQFGWLFGGDGLKDVRETVETFCRVIAG